jgi:3',5'-cyclic AMP phosphodiesterase CpdA
VPGSLFAVSDLHISYAANQRIIDDLRPETDADWLIVAGDVGETFADIGTGLRLLRQRYAKVIWTPGNHELWTLPWDPVQLRGVRRGMSAMY